MRGEDEPLRGDEGEQERTAAEGRGSWFLRELGPGWVAIEPGVYRRVDESELPDGSDPEGSDDAVADALRPAGAAESGGATTGRRSLS